MWEFIGISFHSQLALFLSVRAIEPVSVLKHRLYRHLTLDFYFLARAKNTTFQNKNSCNSEYIIMPDIFKQVFVNDNSLVWLERVGQFS